MSFAQVRRQSDVIGHRSLPTERDSREPELPNIGKFLQQSRPVVDIPTPLAGSKPEEKEVLHLSAFRFCALESYGDPTIDTCHPNTTSPVRNRKRRALPMDLSHSARPRSYRRTRQALDICEIWLMSERAFRPYHTPCAFYLTVPHRRLISTTSNNGAWFGLYS